MANLMEVMVDVACFRQRCAAHATEEVAWAMVAGMPELATMWQSEAATNHAKAEKTLMTLLGVDAIVAKELPE